MSDKESKKGLQQIQDRAREVGERAREASDKASDFAKNVWLAGLGAYGRAFDEAQERLDKGGKLVSREESNQLFDELVAKGEALEAEAKTRLSEARESISIEERISKMRASLGFGHTASADDVARLEKKVDSLAKKVDSLAKPAAKKAPAKKAAAKKAPAKKAAAKK